MEEKLISINASSLSNSKTNLNATEEKPQAPSDNEEGEAKELAEIQSIEKSVNIRFCNYSIIMRAQSFPSGISAQLLALLGGYGSMLTEGGDKSKYADASEDALVGDG